MENQESMIPDAEDRQVRMWAMFLHLSVFCGVVVPIAGLLAPIVIWQVKKDEMPGIDVHGRIVLNWLISVFVYSVVCFILTFIVVGIPIFLLLALLNIIFPIVAGIKANNGEVWKYPLSIPFMKLY